MSEAGRSGDAPSSSPRRGRRRGGCLGRLTIAGAIVLLAVIAVAALLGADAYRHPLGQARGTGGPSVSSTSRLSSGPRQRPAPGSTPLPPLPPLTPERAYFETAWLAQHPAPALPLHDRAAILVDLSSHQTLYANHDLTSYPTASLAKLVTIQVALQHASLGTVLRVPASATHLDADDTRMGLKPGERLTVEELIEGILLESANDAAEVLGTEILPRRTFIYDMNALVRSWGLPGARFSNPTGLDARGERASAYDLAVIAAHLESDQPELLAISSQREIKIPQTSTHQAHDLWTLIGPVLHGFPGATGLKTGFTDAAGYCLALSDQRGDRNLLAIVLDSPTDVQDAEALITYGFSVSPN